MASSLNLSGMKDMLPDLKMEWKRIEKTKKGPTCPICEHRCKTAKGVLQHFLKCYDANYPHNCEECGHRFETRSALRKHTAKGHTIDTDDLNNDSTDMEATCEEEEVCSGEGEGQVDRMDDVVLSDSHDSSHLEDSMSCHLEDTSDSHGDGSSHLYDTHCEEDSSFNGGSTTGEMETSPEEGKDYTSSVVISECSDNSDDSDNGDRSDNGDGSENGGDGPGEEIDEGDEHSRKNVGAVDQISEDSGTRRKGSRHSYRTSNRNGWHHSLQLPSRSCTRVTPLKLPPKDRQEVIESEVIRCEDWMVVAVPNESFEHARFEQELSKYRELWKDNIRTYGRLYCPNYDTCNYSAETAKGMRYHVIRCGGPRIVWNCVLCDKVYAARNGLLNHVRSVHSNVLIVTRDSNGSLSLPNKSRVKLKTRYPNKEERFMARLNRASSRSMVAAKPSKVTPRPKVTPPSPPSPQPSRPSLSQTCSTLESTLSDTSRATAVVQDDSQSSTPSTMMPHPSPSPVAHMSLSPSMHESRRTHTPSPVAYKTPPVEHSSPLEHTPSPLERIPSHESQTHRDLDLTLQLSPTPPPASPMSPPRSPPRSPTPPRMSPTTPPSSPSPFDPLQLASFSGPENGPTFHTEVLPTKQPHSPLQLPPFPLKRDYTTASHSSKDHILANIHSITVDHPYVRWSSELGRTTSCLPSHHASRKVTPPSDILGSLVKPKTSPDSGDSKFFSPTPHMSLLDESTRDLAGPSPAEVGKKKCSFPFLVPKKEPLFAESDMIPGDSIDHQLEVEIIDPKDHSQFAAVEEESGDIYIVDDEHVVDDSLSEMTDVQVDTFCHDGGRIDGLSLMSHIRAAYVKPFGLAALTPAQVTLSNHAVLQVDGTGSTTCRAPTASDVNSKFLLYRRQFCHNGVLPPSPESSLDKFSAVRRRMVTVNLATVEDSGHISSGGVLRDEFPQFDGQQKGKKRKVIPKAKKTAHKSPNSPSSSTSRMLRDEEVGQSANSKGQEVEPSSSVPTHSKEQEVEPSSSASTRSKELLDQNVRSHLLQTKSLSKKREKTVSSNNCLKQISESTNDVPKAKRKKQSIEEEVSIEPGPSKERREKKLSKKKGSKVALNTADHKEGEGVEEKEIGESPTAKEVKRVAATSSREKGQKRKKARVSKAAPTDVKKKPSPQPIPKSVPQNTSLGKAHELFRQILKRHKAIHCSNEGCDYRAISVPAMKYHYERCGRDAHIFVCSKCDKEYTTQPGLKYHMKKAHDIGTPPKPSQEKTTPVPSTSTRKAAEKAVSNIQDMLNEVVQPVTAKPDDPEVSTGQSRDIDPDHDGSVMDPGRVVSLISDIQMDIDSQWKSHQRFVYKPNESNRLIPLLTNKQVHHLRQEIKKNKKAKCPLPDCTSVLGSLQALVYHIPRCYAGTIRTPDKIPSLRTCPVCGNFTGTTAKLQRHLTTRHPDVADSLDFDLEYEPGSLGLTGPCKPTGLTSNVKWMSKLQHRGHYRQWLFSKWESEVFSDESWMSEPAHWKLLDERSVEDFKKDFLDKDDNISANNSEIPKVSFAKSEIGHEGTLFMNSGLAVLGVDWLPLPPSTENRTTSTSANRSQLLAVSTVCSIDVPQPVDEVSTRRGAVQLWSVRGAVGGALESELQMCIAHRYGHVRDMKWCPFAAFKASTNEQPLGRMGLLALACGDGVARILSVPHPQQLAKCYDCEGENPSIPLWVEPAVVQALLCSGPIQREGLSLENGPCFSIEWSRAEGCSKIMAGYSSGLVNIWYLKTSSPLLKLTHTREDAVQCFHPLLQIPAHSSVCSALCWYASDPTLIVTGGYDCKVHVWKTDNPVYPIQSYERLGAGVVRDIIWPMFLKGYIYADEHWKGPYTAVEKLIMQQKKDVISHSVIYSPAPITSLSYSSWNTHLAVGTFSGLVTVRSCWGLNKTAYGRKRKEFPQKNVLHLTSKDTESEEPEPMDVGSTPTSQDVDCPTSVKNEDKVENGEFYDFTKPPCLAVMKVQWNPNESHSQWLAVGTRTGHVMVIDLTRTIS